MRFGWSLALLLPATIVFGQPVFTGDPIDPATGQAWPIQPGLPLIDLGPDGRFGTADDVYDPATVGDVDAVLRTGGTYSGGPIVAPAAGVVAAPEVVAGGHHGGTLVPYRLIVSDGSTPPAAGQPLLGPELDLRRGLIVAFPDLDGDGFLGPTPGAAPLDLQVQRQEALTLAGRTMVELTGGIGAGEMGVSVAAPASAGGLGMLVAGGCVTGATPNLYTDGPMIMTRLPFLLPRDPLKLVGGEATGPIDAINLVDLEIGTGSLFIPPPNHPVLGTPFAVPLDGSSISTDLLRAVSGPAVGAGFGALLDRATFKARLGAVVRPLVHGPGQRDLMTPVDALSLPADGAGNGRTVLVYPADLAGNQTDPPPGGLSVTLEVGPGLVIAAPNTDGDPRHETLTFSSATYVAVTVDDAGPARATPLDEQLIALRNGVPTATLAVTVTAGPGGGPTPDALAHPNARLVFVPKPAKDTIGFGATFPADAATLAATDLTLDLQTNLGPLFALAIPAGGLQGKLSGKSFKYATPAATVGLKLGRDRLNWTLKLKVGRQDLSGSAGAVTSLTADVGLGTGAFATTVPCAANRRGTVTTCR